MRKIKTMILLVIAGVTTLVACNDKRDPGHVYMPDMAYSRAYEANSPNILNDSGIHYIPTPVAGTIRRDDLAPYAGTNDSAGYESSAAVKSPLATLNATEMTEAKRLYNINCAVCHGVNMDAQGPLAVSGKVGGIANLKAGTLVNLSEGTMFHVVTYGKNNMGSYASQLDRKQRWMVVQYVKSEQNKLTGAKTATTDSTKAGASPAAPASTDSAATVKK